MKNTDKTAQDVAATDQAEQIKIDSLTTAYDEITQAIQGIEKIYTFARSYQDHLSHEISKFNDRDQLSDETDQS